MSDDAPRELTPREEAFVEAYCQTQSIAEAGRKARFGRSNSAPYRMYAQPHIQAAIRDRIAYTLGRLGVTTERTLREQASIGYFNPRSIFDENDNILPISKWPDEAAAALASMEIEAATEFRGILRKVKFHSKSVALDAIMKYLGMFGEDNRQTGSAIGEGIGKRMAEGTEAIRALMQKEAAARDDQSPAE